MVGLYGSLVGTNGCSWLCSVGTHRGHSRGSLDGFEPSWSSLREGSLMGFVVVLHNVHPHAYHKYREGWKQR